MTPNMMRWADRWIGVPACWLLTLISYVVRSLRAPAAAPVEPKRILFIGLAEIGALVVTHPAIALARRVYPGCELYFLTFTAGRPMLRLMGFNDDSIFTLDTTSAAHFIWSLFKTLHSVRRKRVDTAVNFEVFVRFGTLLSALSGAARRVAFHRFNDEGHYLGDLTTHRLVYSPHHHAAYSRMSLVRAISDRAETADPLSKVGVSSLRLDRLRLARIPADLEVVRRKLQLRYPALRQEQRLIILNANASDLIAQRRWPVDRYAELARQLLDDPLNVIVLTGTESEAVAGEHLQNLIGRERVINIAGSTTLPELIALFHMGALLVTNDSGPAHFSSTTDIPTIVLFGPETPRIFGPLGPAQEAIYLDYACSPCVSPYNQKRSSCTDNRCMKDITVDRVLTAALRQLRPSG